MFPELVEDLVLPSSPFPDVLQAVIKDNQLVYITSISLANQWAISIQNKLIKERKDIVVVGFDAEWNKSDSKGAPTRLIQISFCNCPTAVINLSKMCIFLPTYFPKQLKKFLERNEIIACGVNIGGDCNRLERLGVTVK